MGLLFCQQESLIIISIKPINNNNNLGILTTAILAKLTRQNPYPHPVPPLSVDVEDSEAILRRRENEVLLFARPFNMENVD
jgi:hypothetical protein